MRSTLSGFCGEIAPTPSLQSRDNRRTEPETIQFSSTFFDRDRKRTDVRTADGGGRGLEAQTDLLVPSVLRTRLGLDLRVEEDVRLLLESALVLDGEFGRHFCGCSTFWTVDKSVWNQSRDLISEANAEVVGRYGCQ